MGEYPLIEEQLVARMVGMHKTSLQFFLQIIHFRSKLRTNFLPCTVEKRCRNSVYIYSSHECLR